MLTGINLGCYRDREAGYALPRLVREAGATPGLARLRLSSIEINHVDDELVAALRETPTVARHLHVPLQSGDDGVLRAMGRRYDGRHVPAAARAARRLQPDDRRDRRLPGRGRARRSRARSRSSRRPASRRCTSSRTRRGRARRPRRRTPVPREVKRERSARLREASRAACLARWREKLGREDVVLVDRPGRGYGDDYSPWLVDAPVGELVRVRGAAVTEEGIRAA